MSIYESNDQLNLEKELTFIIYIEMIYRNTEIYYRYDDIQDYQDTWLHI